MTRASFSSKMRSVRRNAALLSHPFIFIHIPKTGGTSVRNALGMGPMPHHVRASMLWQDCPEATGKFSFTFVRNPWDRLISSYYFNHGADAWEQPGRFHRSGMVQQVDFILDAAGKPLVDFIGRFEHLEEDFATICGILGRPVPPLPHLNRTEHRPYRELYDEAAKQYVAHFFAEDIRRFGYSF